MLDPKLLTAVIIFIGKIKLTADSIRYHTLSLTFPKGILISYCFFIITCYKE